MPISPFLDGHKFDPETKRIMGIAFEMTCIALGLTDQDDLANGVTYMLVRGGTDRDW